MFSFLPRPIIGVLSLLLLVLNTLVILTPFFLIAILKLLTPIPSWRRRFSLWLEELVTWWVAGNSWWYELTRRPTWDVQGVDGLEMSDLTADDWYIVGSNHRSWADILVLQRIFNRRIPMLKFFLKQELIWVPLMGFAWWALDFPFMKRYSKEYLAKHPEKQGKDLETTRKATQNFRLFPSSVIIFLEGTRFTQSKNAQQKAPFSHLLKPKAGGIGYVLSLMGDQIGTLLNVTIAYPQYVDRALSFWDYLSGRVTNIVIRVEKIKIPHEFRSGDYMNDEEYRQQFQAWVNGLWVAKDRLLAELMVEGERV